jgi:hypothetical protein
MVMGLTLDSMASGHGDSDFLVKLSGRCGRPSFDGVEGDEDDAFASLTFELQALAPYFRDQLAALTAGFRKMRARLRSRFNHRETCLILRTIIKIVTSIAVRF